MKAQILQCAIFEEDDENILGQQDRDAQPAGHVGHGDEGGSGAAVHQLIVVRLMEAK